MADLKITALGAAAALDGSELVEAVQGGVNVQTTTQDIADLGGVGGGHVIEEEGTPLTARTKLNFEGDGVDVTDDSGDDATVVTIGSPAVALTRVDDTNVILTLGGSHATALVNAASITVGWTGQLASSRGGTGADNSTQTYTPTLTNTTNVAASTAAICQYYRNGNVVTVSGTLTIDPTTTATLTTLGISLPIASDFTNVTQAGGTAVATAVADAAAAIFADATNNRATLQYVCTDVTNHVMAFTFTYLIL